MGRVLGIDGIELVGINNRSLGNIAFVYIASSHISGSRMTLWGCEFCCGQFSSVEESHKSYIFVSQKHLKWTSVIQRSFLKESMVDKSVRET